MTAVLYQGATVLFVEYFSRLAWQFFFFFSIHFIDLKKKNNRSSSSVLLFDQLWQQDEVTWLNSLTQSMNPLQIDMSFVIRRHFGLCKSALGMLFIFWRQAFVHRWPWRTLKLAAFILNIIWNAYGCLHPSVSSMKGSPLWSDSLKERWTYFEMEGFLNPWLILFVLCFSLILFLKLVILMPLISEPSDDLIFCPFTVFLNSGLLWIRCQL